MSATTLPPSLADRYTIVRPLDAAQPEVDAIRRTMPDMPYGVQADALLRAERGDVAGARALVDHLDLSPFDQHLTFHFAEVFAVLGEDDRAIDVMEMAIRKGFLPYLFFREHCRFVSRLRGQPRFEALVQEAERRSARVRTALALTFSAGQ